MARQGALIRSRFRNFAPPFFFSLAGLYDIFRSLLCIAVYVCEQRSDFYRLWGTEAADW